jgi:FtsP/CotA-like multicopper oxidase with cupredoxin domain
MTNASMLFPTRRAVTAGLAASLLNLDRSPAQPAAAASDEGWRTLTAAPRRMKLHPEAAAEAEVWAFDGQIPGPVLRVRHGDEARFRFQNRTERPLSLHWHGVRGPNAMDGVGGLTQEAVLPGKDFDYRFTPPDSGTYLVRPLVIGGSSEPTERGLSAVLVVEERDPPKVDREFALLVDDWRLNEDGTLSPFGNAMEAATNGRLGNWLAVNAKSVPERITAAPGSRIRLRLANGCNARSTRIRFDDLKVYVIAIDGQPTDTFEPLRSTLPFSPGSRYDLLIDVPPEGAAKGQVTALLGQGVALVAIASEGEPAKQPLPPIAPLAPNKLLSPSIRLQDAVRRDFVIAGGARRSPKGELTFEGDPSRIWTVNGAAGSTSAKPLVSVKRGTPVVLTVVNTTPTVQPLHLHGHAFRLLHPFDDGWEPYWLDTLQVPEGRTLRIAFVADNPGRWLLASTVLERFDTGLWSWLEVT